MERRNLGPEFISRTWAFEAAMNGSHLSRPIDKQRRWKREKVVHLALQPAIDIGIVKVAAKEQGVRQAESLPEEMQILLCQFGIVLDFERQSHNLEAHSLMLSLQLLKD